MTPAQQAYLLNIIRDLARQDVGVAIRLLEHVTGIRPHSVAATLDAPVGLRSLWRVPSVSTVHHVNQFALHD
jgi:hypothetical protein